MANEAASQGDGERDQDTCRCVPKGKVRERRTVRFHTERQDTSAPAWRHLLDLVDEAAADGREVFRPLAGLSPRERRQIVTLPPTIAGLTAVRRFSLYGSNIVRIPPEIGAMTSLEEFTPYTSYRLHWFPYELTRCVKLKSNVVSTRALFGNFKVRAAFPAVEPARDSTAGLDLGDLDPGTWGAAAIRACSVCDRPLEEAGIHQAWISLRVAAEVLPLLVNACSAACVQALPDPSPGYVPAPHTGGPGIAQPPPGFV